MAGSEPTSQSLPSLWERLPPPVKTRPAAAGVARDPQRRRSKGFSAFRRHLEGWPLAVVAVGIALLSLVLFLPRPATSLVIPLPPFDWREAKRVAEVDRRLATEAEGAQLSFNVRAVGEAIRNYGKKEQHGEATATDYNDVRRLARLALKSDGAENLLRLRALEVQLFLSALEEFREDGIIPDDLGELGGNFMKKAENGRWFERRFPISLLELTTLFRIRWTELTDLGAESAFKVTLNEWRVYYGFLLRQFDPRTERLATGVGYVQALSRRDSTYPTYLATGVLYHQYQAYPLAVEAFQRHMELQTEGPWSLAAKNYLAGALEAASGVRE